MGDTKPYPLAEEAPRSGNNVIQPESGPAMKELQRNRESEGSHLDWGKGDMVNNYKRAK